MNVIDIVILSIFGICLVSGMYKGFIASGLTVLGFIVAWFAAKATYGALSEAILSNSSLMGVLSTYLEAADFFPSAQIASATVTEALASSTTIWNNALAAIQERLPFLAEAFASNVNTQAFASLGITTLADYLDQTIWTAAFQLLSFILLFFISYAVVTLLINLLSRVLRFPALRGFDAIAGGLFGFALFEDGDVRQGDIALDHAVVQLIAGAVRKIAEQVEQVADAAPDHSAASPGLVFDGSC